MAPSRANKATSRGQSPDAQQIAPFFLMASQSSSRARALSSAHGSCEGSDRRKTQRGESQRVD